MFCSAVFLLTLFASAISTPDYFWRPFDGTIPTDAIIISDSTRAKNLFIGKAPVWGGGLYVGELYEGEKQIIVTGRPHNPTPVWIVQHDIEILCTRSPELLEWFPTNSTTLYTIPYNLVQGGYQYEAFWPLYIGRVIHNDQFVIGKITSDQDEEGSRNTLFIYDENINDEKFYKTYDVLVYKGLKNNNNNN